jgi:hypothetical protein
MPEQGHCDGLVTEKHAFFVTIGLRLHSAQEVARATLAARDPSHGKAVSQGKSTEKSLVS